MQLLKEKKTRSSYGDFYWMIMLLKRLKENEEEILSESSFNFEDLAELEMTRKNSCQRNFFLRKINMNINQCLDCKIRDIASNFARSKKNMKY